MDGPARGQRDLGGRGFECGQYSILIHRDASFHQKVFQLFRFRYASLFQLSCNAVSNIRVICYNTTSSLHLTPKNVIETVL